MQILFVHRNFPAQFGPALSRLAKRPDLDCVFVSRTGTASLDGVRRIQFSPRGGATRANHYCSRTFENAVWHAHAVYEACKATPWLRPDLIVGHSGFGSTVFLQELYACPIINYFEYYYHPRGTDMDFRPEFPPSELDYLRSHTRNAMILLDLDACAAGYTPTQWQWSLLPPGLSSKIDVIHDGVDLELWRRRRGPRRLGDEALADDVRVVTYVARGLEAMRGFDVFVRVPTGSPPRCPTSSSSWSAPTAPRTEATSATSIRRLSRSTCSCRSGPTSVASGSSARSRRPSSSRCCPSATCTSI
jgi:glycosyltransferase involved in cell wall biosynthesis